MRTLLVALTLLPALQAQAPTLASRVTEAEATVARHFRGEPLEKVRARVMADIAAYNGENAAGDGVTMKLNGTTYSKGLGVHAASDAGQADERYPSSLRSRMSSATFGGVICSQPGRPARSRASTSREEMGRHCSSKSRMLSISWFSTRYAYRWRR